RRGGGGGAGLPLPPFHPDTERRAPAPPPPSAPGPAAADRIAAMTWSRVTWNPRMSLSPPSLVSPTSALTDRTCSLPGCASVYATTPSTAVPTLSVLVST